MDSRESRSALAPEHETPDLHTRVVTEPALAVRDLPVPAPRRPRARLQPATGYAHPVVLVDPRPETLVFVRSLRPRGTCLVALSSRRLEPTLYARSVQRHRLPPLTLRPERWQATLLELAARLEPRPLLFACSLPGLDLLRSGSRTLAPHYVLANTSTWIARPNEPLLAEPDRALRRAVMRGEAALEVQMVLDAAGRRTGVCVLAWAPGAAPDVVVTSVLGSEVAERTETWLRSRSATGYARLVWSPDRFGRLQLQATSSLPGPGLLLAWNDGIDFPALAYAAAAGFAAEPQFPRRTLVRRLSIADPGPEGDATRLVDLAPAATRRDPLPWIAGFLRSLVRA